MTLIRQLKNPMTEHYQSLKDYSLSSDILFTYHGATCDGNSSGDIYGSDTPFLSHLILGRPRPNNGAYPQEWVDRGLVQRIDHALQQILYVNNIQLGCWFRININSIPTVPENDAWGAIHNDHNFDHTNMIVYLNTPKCGGGQTRVYNSQWKPNLTEEPSWDEYEDHFPKEDDVIIFPGRHFHHGKGPIIPGDRRTFIVATFHEAIRAS
jgi:hypothetical protein